MLWIQAFIQHVFIKKLPCTKHEDTAVKQTKKMVDLVVLTSSEKDKFQHIMIRVITETVTKKKKKIVNIKRIVERPFSHTHTHKKQYFC